MAEDENNTEETPEAAAAQEAGEPEQTPEVEAPAADESAAEVSPPVEEAAT